MGRKLNKLKKIRIHREGTHTLIAGAGGLLLFNACLYYAFECKLPFYVSATVCTVIYLIVVNFFRCPIRRFEGDTENVVVAPADGKIVVIEEVDENEYFHDRRLMVSIFMSLTNVHANWIPVDGTVRLVEHHDGNFHKAWLPKASIENERSTIVIETPDGVFIMARQIAGAMARRIVTYAREDEDCISTNTWDSSSSVPESTFSFRSGPKSTSNWGKRRWVMKPSSPNYNKMSYGKYHHTTDSQQHYLLQPDFRLYGYGCSFLR